MDSTTSSATTTRHLDWTYVASITSVHLMPSRMAHYLTLLPFASPGLIARWHVRKGVSRGLNREKKPYKEKKSWVKAEAFEDKSDCPTLTSPRPMAAMWITEEKPKCLSPCWTVWPQQHLKTESKLDNPRVGPSDFQTSHLTWVQKEPGPFERVGPSDFHSKIDM